MLNYDQALKILYSFDFGPNDDWDKHSIMVANIAYKLALEIEKCLNEDKSGYLRERYPDFNAEKVRVMGLVHDFGRHKNQDPFFHAYEGFSYMLSIGETELARICACHSNGTHRLEDIQPYGLRPEDFYCTTLEEKLVFMADNSDYRGKLTKNTERIAETIKRYTNTNQDFIPILKMKIKEYAEFDKEIQKITGKTSYKILGI